MRTSIMAAGVMSLASLFTAATASAGFQSYYAEDLGLGEDTRLTSHPLADAARAAFLANTTGVGTESFESFAEGTQLPIQFMLGADIVTLSGPREVQYIPSGTNGVGRYPSDGDKYVETNTDGDLTLTFSAPQALVGFYAIDIGDFDGQLIVDLFNGATPVDSFTVPNTVNAPGGGALYFGLIGDASSVFTSVKFRNTGGIGEYFALDQVSAGRICQVAPAIPLPAGVWAGAGMLGAMGAIRRIRKSIRA